jgi:hypothetical protein
MIDVRFEMDFWTGILKEHAQFQYDSLSPDETEAIAAAKDFRDRFSALHAQVESGLGEVPLAQLESYISDNKVAVTQFVQYKKNLMKRLLTCNIKLTMTPSFLNHMINEAMEYYRVLSIIDESLRINYVLENLRLHKVWLSDASGHSDFIVSQLDGVEILYLTQAMEYMTIFDGLFKKAYEMYLFYERTGMDNGGLTQFNRDTERVINDFTSYLETLSQLTADCRIYKTGTFSPMVLDHMIREENYYLKKVRESET